MPPPVCCPPPQPRPTLRLARPSASSPPACAPVRSPLHAACTAAAAAAPATATALPCPLLLLLPLPCGGLPCRRRPCMSSRSTRRRGSHRVPPHDIPPTALTHPLCPPRHPRPRAAAPCPPRRVLVPLTPAKPCVTKGKFTLLSYNLLADLYATVGGRFCTVAAKLWLLCRLGCSTGVRYGGAGADASPVLRASSCLGSPFLVMACVGGLGKES